MVVGFGAQGSGGGIQDSGLRVRGGGGGSGIRQRQPGSDSQQPVFDPTASSEDALPVGHRTCDCRPGSQAE